MLNDGNKPSSAGLKTEKKLLHFGLDYLTLNICDKDDISSTTVRYLDAIFSLDHNTTNSNIIRDFVWADSMEEIRIIFSESPDGEVAQIHWKESYLFQIAQIDHESPKWKNTKYSYKYRIQFYGDFFNSVRTEKIEEYDFLNIFIEDIENNTVKNSLSRLDVCSDISNISPKEILKDIKGTHLKKISEFEKDKKTGEMETFYYGKRGGNTTWFIRCYNKLADCRKKFKENLYREYFFYEKVTRLEAEVKTDTLKLNKVNMINIQDNNFLWSLYFSLLKTKYNSWGILPFLKREMKKNGFKKIPLEKRDHEPMPLSRERFRQRFVSSANNFFKRYELNPAIYILKEFPRFEDETLKYITNSILETKASSNQNNFTN